MKKTFLATTLVAFTATSILAAPLTNIPAHTAVNYDNSYYQDNRLPNNYNRATFNDDNYHYPHYDNSGGFEQFLTFGFITAFIALVARMIAAD